MFNIPLQLVSGSGKGVSYSSLHQIGEMVPSQKLGQGQVQVIANVATGSLMIRDHLLRIMETTGPLEIGYFYNSQKNVGDGLWQLMPAKRFKSFPTSQQPTAVLVEDDGHETTYTKASDARMYFASGLENGTPYLKFDEGSGQWVWYHPGSGMKEIYHAQGYLLKRIDRDGHQTTFEYEQPAQPKPKAVEGEEQKTSCNNDKQLQLLAITSDKRHRYEIKRSKNKTSNGIDYVVIREIKENQVTLLQRHEFDSQGRLLNTCVPDNSYVIHYTYASEDSGLIQTITQTDQTNMAFGYTDDGLLNQVRMDNNRTKYELDRRQYQSARQIIFKTSAPSALTIHLDEKQDRVVQLDREEGILGKKYLTQTTYSYTDNNQLAKVTHPDGGIESYEYDQSYGLITSIQKPDGQKVKYVYNTPSEEPQLLCEIRSLVQEQSVKSIVRRYVYDEDWDQKHLRHTFLRFEISPTGQVTEYRPDKNGFVGSRRIYLQAIFDISDMKADVSPSLNQMLEWVSQLTTSKAVQLTDYAYDDRGQLRIRQSYTEVDEKGNGVNNDGRSYELTECNRFGLCTDQTTRQSATVNTTLKKTFDPLSRLQEIQDALGYKTSTQYNDEKSQAIVTYPNGRTKNQIKDSRGLVNSETETVLATAEKANQKRIAQEEIDTEIAKRQRKIATWKKLIGLLTPQLDSLKKESNRLATDQDIERQIAHAQNQLKILEAPISLASSAPSHSPGVQVEVVDEKVAHVQSVKQEEKKESKEEKKREQKLNATSSVSSASNKNQGNQTRQTGYMRDHLGRIIVTQHPDQQKTYTFYDQQNRLAFAVSALGYVTGFVFDPINHYKMTAQYAHAIDPAKLWIDPDIVPSIQTLSDLLDSVKDPSQDRYQYQFADRSGRTHYEVDAENYLTEYVYDSLDRMTAKILYANPISTNQLTVLKQGKTLTLTPDWTKDRRWQYQYNDDNQLVLEVDPANYAIQYRRDIGGRIVETIRYDSPMSANRLTASDQDAHTYSYYDARGQKIAEVDAEKYLTTWTYLACGLVSQMTHYANGVVDSDWEKDKTRPPKLPATSTEDQVTVYRYDLLNRPAEVYQPFARAETTQYDCMNNQTSFRRLDVTASPMSTDPSHQRQTLSRYDLWDQPIAQASVYVGQELAKIDVDDKLTPEQKQTAKEVIWQNNSTRHQFDPVSGLKLSTTDALGGKTYYYYDRDGHLRVTVNAIGAVIQNVLNAFGEAISVRSYYKRFPTEKLPLEGGYLTEQLQKVLDDLKDDQKDRVVLLSRNLRGKVIQKTDPRGYISKKSYNAFKEVVREELPVDSLQPTLVITHDRDVRGLEWRSIQQSGSLTKVEQKQYASPYGQVTTSIDAVGAHTDYSYNRLGQVVEVTNALGVLSHRYERDAFNRIVSDQDATGAVSEYQYDQLKRTCTTLHPEPGTFDIEQRNVFEEVIMAKNCLNQGKIFKLNPGGQITQTTDALNQTSIAEFNLLGWQMSNRDTMGVETQFVRNEAGQLTAKVEDSQGLKRTTQYVPNTFGQNEKVIDPKSIVTLNAFNLNGDLTQSIMDPDSKTSAGLNLITQRTYQVCGIQTSEKKGDAKESNQYEETYTVDGFNRQSGTVIDPASDLKKEPKRNQQQVVSSIEEEDDFVLVSSSHEADSKEAKSVLPESKQSISEGGVLTSFASKTSLRTHPVSTQQSAQLHIPQVSSSSSMTILTGLSHNNEVKLEKEPQNTKGEGDCAFHAILGEWDAMWRQYECLRVNEKRAQVARFIQESKLTDPVIHAVKEAIQQMIIGGMRIPADSFISDVKGLYQRHLAKNSSAIDQAWLRFERVLRGHRVILEYIGCDEKSDAKTLKSRFQSSLNKESGLLYGLILSIDETQTAFDRYQQVTSESFDWNKRLEGRGIIEDYIQFIKQPRQWLLPSELAIIAYAFHISVEFFTIDPDTHQKRYLDTYNPHQSKTVSICFNGLNHYQRMEVPIQSRSALRASATAQSSQPGFLAPLNQSTTALSQKVPVNHQEHGISASSSKESKESKEPRESKEIKANKSSELKSAGSSVSSQARLQDHLAITRQQKLDPLDRVIAEKDPNGNVTWTLYDKLGQKRFKVDAIGGVTEWIYTSIVNQIQSQRIYAVGIDPKKMTEQITPEQLQSLVKVDPTDNLRYYFYDQNGRERFQIQVLGDEKDQPATVQEKRYDIAGQEVYRNQFAALVTQVNWTQLKIQDVATLMKAKEDVARDRITYKIWDAKGQERFVIDSLGFVKEKRFDAMGRIIIECSYSKFVNNPAEIAQLPADQVLSHLTQDPAQDRMTVTIFDSLGQPHFVVQPEGNVGYFEHDAQGHVTLECAFSQAVQMPATYEELVKILGSWKPDSKKDRVTQYQYDAAGRKVSKTDALGCIERYQYDAVGNLIGQTDRNGNQWKQQFDRANRLISKQSPKVSVTQVALSQDHGHLEYKSSDQSIETRIDHDPAGNEIVFTEGNGLVEARTLNCHYTALHQLESKELPQVPINDATNKNLSLHQRPEKLATLKSQLVYNAKGLKVAEQDLTESGTLGGWTFIIYDAANRPVYIVDPVGGVTKSEYDAFGKVIKKTAYANAVQLDFQQYVTTGISREILEKALVPDANQDRAVESVYDQQGNCISEKRGAVFFYSSQDASVETGIAQPETQARYNAFGNCVYTRQLIDSKSWSERWSWFNRNGKKVADCNPMGYVMRTPMSVWGQEVGRAEYAKPLAQLPSPGMSLETLEKMIVTDAQDRLYRCEYDLRGQKTKDIQVNVVVQKLVRDSQGVPSLQDQAPQDAVKTYYYDNEQHLIAVKDEKGNMHYNYYDARGSKRAETKMARTCVNEKGQTLVLVPLTHFLVDAFGKAVATIRYKQGTTPPNPAQFPQPIAADAEDQAEIQLMDNRGLAQYSQDAEGCLTSTTYAASKDVASQCWPSSGYTQIQLETKLESKPESKEQEDSKESKEQKTTKPTKSSVQYQLTHHVDGKIFRYDLGHRPYLLQILRDGQRVQTTQTGYNTFGDAVAEGPGDGSFPVYRLFDKSGAIWNTNSNKGVNTISLRNLAGYETVQLQSPTQSLQSVAYSQLKTIIEQWAAKDLEHTQSRRNLSGQVTARTFPSYLAVDPDDNVLGVPLNIVVSDRYLKDNAMGLSWVVPQERAVKPIFSIWPVGQESKKQVLDIQYIAGRCIVDVSKLSSDIYSYEIDYYSLDSAVQKPLYKTVGKVQFDTKLIQGSCYLVPVVEYVCADEKATVKKFDPVVRLTGNTTGVEQVELYQNGQMIECLNVELDSQKRKVVNLKKFTSGAYQIMPALSQNKAQVAQLSLPFTIYTDTPSSQPLSYEIPCEAQLLTLLQGSQQYGQVIWSVPQIFQYQPIKIVCEYFDQDSKLKKHSDILDWSTNKGEFKDSTGKTLKCNTLFEFQVKQIQSLSLSVLMGDEKTGVWIPLYNREKPKPGEAELKKMAEWVANKRKNHKFHKQQLAQKARLEAKECQSETHAQKVQKSLRSYYVIPESKQDVSTSSSYSSSSSSSALSSSCSSLSPSWSSHSVSPQKGDVIVTTEFSPYTMLYVTPWSSSKKSLKKNIVNAFEHIPASSNSSKANWHINLGKPEPRYIPETSVRQKHSAELYLQYWDITMDRQAVWKDLPFVDAGNGVVCNITGFAPGNYPYRLIQAKNEEKPVFTVSQGGIPYSSDAISDPKKKWLPGPAQKYELDRWNNPTGQTNTKGDLTTCMFNLRNQMIKRVQPPVPVTLPNGDGQVRTLSPVTLSGYDIAGSLVGVTNPNGNTTGYLLDEACQRVSLLLPDGAEGRKNVFDSFGRVSCYRDEAGEWWKFIYNHRNQVTRFIMPPPDSSQPERVNTYTYNESGSRIAQADPAGNTQRYHTDAVGNIVIRYDAEDKATYTTRERNGLPVRIDNPDGTYMTWNRSDRSNPYWYWGIPTTHTDLSQANYTYAYDFKNQLVRQTSSGGNHGDCLEVGAGYRRVSLGWFGFIEIPVYYTVRKSTPSQDIVMTYALGDVVQVDDNAHHQVTYYTHDTEHCLTGLQVYSLEDGDRTLLRSTSSIMDAVGREIRVDDSMGTFTTGYDLNGNRTCVTGTLIYDVAHPLYQESWYTYDARDRVLISDGVRVKSQEGKSWIVQVTEKQGLEISYLSGRRRTESILDARSGQRLIGTLDYDRDGRLTHTKSADLVETWREYATSGYIGKYTEAYGLQSETKEHQIACTPNGYQYFDQQSENGSPKTTTSFGLNNMGLPITQTIKYIQNPWVRDDLNISYIGFETQNQSRVGGTRSDPDGPSAYSSANGLFTANGMSSGQIGVDDSRFDGFIPPTVAFTTTYDGIIPKKLYIENEWSDFFWEMTYQKWISERFIYDVRGNPKASYSLSGDDVPTLLRMPSNEDVLLCTHSTLLGGNATRGHELQRIHTLPDNDTSRSRIFELSQMIKGIIFARNGSSSYDPNPHDFGEIVSAICAVILNPKLLSSAPFFFSPAARHRMGGSYPQMTPTNYTVVEGDTFETIAQHLFGDSNFASAIAESNGWTASADPKPGQVLTIPQFIGSRNNAWTARPYQDFMRIMVKNLMPHLDTPQPDDDDDGFFDFLEIVVSVVACVVIAWAAPPAAMAIISAVGVAETAVTVTVVTAGVAALMDVAAQELLVGVGLQDHFSLQQALETGVTVGIGAGFAGDLAKASTLRDIPDALLTFGKVAVAQQLTEMALGLKNRFDVREVISSIASNFINAGIGKGVTNGAMRNVATSIIDVPLGAAIMGSHASIQSMAIQMLGTTFGKTLGDMAVEEMQGVYQKAAANSQASEQKNIGTNGSSNSKGANSTRTISSSDDQQSSQDQSDSKASPSRSRGSNTHSSSRSNRSSTARMSTQLHSDSDDVDVLDTSQNVSSGNVFSSSQKYSELAALTGNPDPLGVTDMFPAIRQNTSLSDVLASNGMFSNTPPSLLVSDPSPRASIPWYKRDALNSWNEVIDRRQYPGLVISHASDYLLDQGFNPFVSKPLKVVGGVAIPIVIAGIDIYENPTSRNTVAQVGKLVGGFIGGAAGGALGSLAPGAGTMAGAIAGEIFGSAVLGPKCEEAALFFYDTYQQIRRLGGPG